jgi:Domain of unknown function (DUF2382)
MTSEPVLPPVIGAIADDRHGNPLGTVTAVFVDDVTGQPTWVGLTDGLHAAPDAADVAIVAPIADAQFSDGRLRLAVPADAVHSAPRPGAPDRLSPAEEVTLREHYAGGSGRTDTERIDTGRTDTELIDIGDVQAARGGTVGGDTAMTRSEERITVDTVVQPWARAVLRIETVTEEVMVPVTISRQRARIEYLPLRATDGTLTDGTLTAGIRDHGVPGTGARDDGAREGGALTAGTRDDGDLGTPRARRGRATEWVTLYGDQPVVTLERAPVERVRLTTEWVTEEQAVAAELRHEEIELTETPRA